MHMLTVLAFAAATLSAGAETYRLDDFVWKNSNSNSQHLASVPLKDFTPGMRAEVSMWVDASGMSGGKSYPEASVAWGNRFTGSGWANGSSTVRLFNDRRIEKDAKGRRKLVCRTMVMPSYGCKPRLYFFAKPPAVGTVVYSDIEVKVFPRTFKMLMRSDAYREEAAEGSVRFGATFVTDPDLDKTDRAASAFVFRGADGRTVRRSPDTLTHESAEITLPVADLAMGPQDVRFELAIAGKKVDETSCAFQRLAKAPAHRVQFDREKFAVVGGRRFFPIGMYWSEATLAKSNALERYVEPGVFNCVQTYEKSMSHAILDRYWSKGLMVMASVKDIYLPLADGTPIAFLPKGIRTKADETAYVAKIVNRCKDHPALLAWYTSDEMGQAFADRLEDRYRLMKELDPDHPVFVLAFEDSTRGLMRSYDVTGEDCYNICDGHSKPAPPGMGEAWVMADHADVIQQGMLRLKPLWQITQAYKTQFEPSRKNRWDLRFPTRRELAAQTWQQVAVGANGIFFYSYGQINRETILESEFMEYFDETVVPVAREMKSVEDVLVLDPGPAVTAKPARVRVRTWKKPGSWLKGDETYVLVCNCYPEFRSGTVRLEGKWTSCEPVFGSGVTLADGQLSLALRPLANAMVRLR